MIFYLQYEHKNVTLDDFRGGVLSPGYASVYDHENETLDDLSGAPGASPPWIRQRRQGWRLHNINTTGAGLMIWSIWDQQQFLTKIWYK